MDAIKLLKDDHDRIRRLFKEIEKSQSAGERRLLFEQVASDLRSHAIVEEKLVYAPLKVEATGRDRVALAHEAHLIVARLVRELEETSPTDERWTAKLELLADILARHVKDEHRRIFPRLEAMLDKQERARIGTRIELTYAAARA